MQVVSYRGDNWYELGRLQGRLESRLLLRVQISRRIVESERLYELYLKYCVKDKPDEKFEKSHLENLKMRQKAEYNDLIKFAEKYEFVGDKRLTQIVLKESEYWHDKTPGFNE